jgi:hypothetical protein
MDTLARAGRTISIASFWICVIVSILVIYRGMRSIPGYLTLGILGFAAGFAPAFVDHEWIRGVGVGFSAGVTLMLVLRIPYPGPKRTVRSHGRTAVVDWLTLAELVLSLVSGALWTFLDDPKLWLAVVCLALVLALLSAEYLVRSGHPYARRSG